MSFFAQRWGVSRGLGDEITQPTPKTEPEPQPQPDMTAIEAAKDFYDQTGLSDKNFSADDRAKANELNKKFDEFKIPRYAICSPRGGVSYRAIGESCNDKENIRYTSEKVLSRYLDNNFGVGLDTFKSNSITELRGKIKPKEKKADKPKSEPKAKKEDKPEPKAKADKPKSEPKAKKEDKPEPKPEPKVTPCPPVAKPKPEPKVETPKPDTGSSPKNKELNQKIDNLTELLNRAVKKPAA